MKEDNQEDVLTSWRALDENEREDFPTYFQKYGEQREKIFQKKIFAIFVTVLISGVFILGLNNAFPLFFSDKSYDEANVSSMIKAFSKEPFVLFTVFIRLIYEYMFCVFRIKKYADIKHLHIIIDSFYGYIASVTFLISFAIRHIE